MELLKQIYEKVTYELSDNRHVEHLTKLFHVKGKHLKLPKDKDERYLCPNSNEEVEMIKPDLFREESITEDQTHPHNLDPKALEFVLDMRRRRYIAQTMKVPYVNNGLDPKLCLSQRSCRVCH